MSEWKIHKDPYGCRFIQDPSMKFSIENEVKMKEMSCRVGHQFDLSECKEGRCCPYCWPDGFRNYEHREKMNEGKEIIGSFAEPKGVISFNAGAVGSWLMQLSPKGIKFNRDSYPDATPDAFAEAVIGILENQYDVKFNRKDPPYDRNKEEKMNEIEASPQLGLFFKRLLTLKGFIKDQYEISDLPILEYILIALDDIIKEAPHE